MLVDMHPLLAKLQPLEWQANKLTSAGHRDAFPNLSRYYLAASSSLCDLAWLAMIVQTEPADNLQRACCRLCGCRTAAAFCPQLLAACKGVIQPCSWNCSCTNLCNIGALTL